MAQILPGRRATDGIRVMEKCSEKDHGCVDQTLAFVRRHTQACVICSLLWQLKLRLCMLVSPCDFTALLSAQGAKPGRNGGTPLKEGLDGSEGVKL